MRIIWSGRSINVPELEALEQYRLLSDWDRKRMFWMLPVCLVTPVAVLVKTCLLWGCDIDLYYLNIGLLISLPLFFAHELLHALVYPHETPTYIYYDQLGVGASNLTAMPKKRFMLACLMPMLTLGVLPLLVLLLTPNWVALNSILSAVAFVHLCCTIGDLTVCLSVSKLPDDAWIQISGNSIYWKEGA